MCGLTEREFGISRQQLDAIRDWAQNDPYVQEVRVFGSDQDGPKGFYSIGRFRRSSQTS